MDGDQGDQCDHGDVDIHVGLELRVEERRLEGEK